MRYQALRYLFASGLSACVTLGLPVLLHEVAGFVEAAAVGISLMAAFILNFFTTKHFVFNSKGNRYKEAALYGASSLFFRGAEYIAFLLLFNLLHLHYMVALVMVLVTSAAFKFLAYKFVVFKPAGAAAVYAPSGDMDAKNRTYHIVQDHMKLLPNYYRWTYARAKKHITGTVVELGCGAGFGISCYLDNVDKVYAVDHSPELLAEVKAAYPSAKVEAVQADLIGEWNDLGHIKADTIIMMDVLEHFKDDRDFLEKASKMLKPGGQIIVKVPADSKLYGNIDIASGHYRRYDRADLNALSQRLGLALSQIGLINMPGAVMYGFKKHNNSNFSKTFSTAQLKFINLIIPLIRFGDDVLRVVLGPVYKGLSFIAVYKN